MAMHRRPDVRFLTPTVAGGVGKTRLGVRVARCLLNHIEHGDVFVPLAPIMAPDIVPSIIAATIGVDGADGR